MKLPAGVKVQAENDEVLALIETPKTEEELKAEEAAEAGGIESIEVLTAKKPEEGEEGVQAEKPAEKTEEGK